jgi:two-component system chemotaxis response regulator CheB
VFVTIHFPSHGTSVLPRFRCRVGHAWTGEGLVQKQSDILGDALWTALRSLEESVSLARQFAERHKDRGNQRLAVGDSEESPEASRATGD